MHWWIVNLLAFKGSSLIVSLCALTYGISVCHNIALERNILQSVEDEALKHKIYFTDKMERTKVSTTVFCTAL